MPVTRRRWASLEIAFKTGAETVTLLKMMSGAVLVLGGILGIGLCSFVGAEIHGNTKQLRTEIPDTIGQIEHVVRTVHRQGESAKFVLKTTRGHLADIEETVEQLSDDRRNSELASILREWNQEISRSLEHADDFVKAMESSLHSASSALLLVESIPLFRPQRDSTSKSGQGDLKNLADHLKLISSMLSQVHMAITEIRTNRSVDKQQIRQLREVFVLLDSELGLVQNEIDLFTRQMQRIVQRLSHTRENSPRWIANVALLSNAFLSCVALSQAVVVIQGCRWLRRDPIGKGTP
jgi:chromosome segregation ATPase